MFHESRLHQHSPTISAVFTLFVTVLVLVIGLCFQPEPVAGPDAPPSPLVTVVPSRRPSGAREPRSVQVLGVCWQARLRPRWPRRAVPPTRGGVHYGAPGPAPRLPASHPPYTEKQCLGHCVLQAGVFPYVGLSCSLAVCMCRGPSCPVSLVQLPVGRDPRRYASDGRQPCAGLDPRHRPCCTPRCPTRRFGTRPRGGATLAV